MVSWLWVHWIKTTKLYSVTSTRIKFWKLCIQKYEMGHLHKIHSQAISINTYDHMHYVYGNKLFMFRYTKEHFFQTAEFKGFFVKKLWKRICIYLTQKFPLKMKIIRKIICICKLHWVYLSCICTSVFPSECLIF